MACTNAGQYTADGRYCGDGRISDAEVCDGRQMSVPHSVNCRNNCLDFDCAPGYDKVTDPTSQLPTCKPKVDLCQENGAITTVGCSACQQKTCREQNGYLSWGACETGPDCPSCTGVNIITQPADKTITSGQTTTLSVVASGTAPLSYQWYQGIPTDTSHPVGTDASTFTTPALNATTSYWVKVTNSCGTANSNTATVTVTPTCNGCSIAGTCYQDRTVNPNNPCQICNKSVNQTDWSINTNTSQVCRAADGDCDVDEYCTGSSISCPNNSFKNLTTLCRDATDLCDAKEYCTGSTASCPNDLVKSANTPCGNSLSCDLYIKGWGTGTSSNNCYKRGVENVTASCDGTAKTCPNISAANCKSSNKALFFITGTSIQSRCGSSECAKPTSSGGKCTTNNLVTTVKSLSDICFTSEQHKCPDGQTCNQYGACEAANCITNTDCDNQPWQPPYNPPHKTCDIYSTGSLKCISCISISDNEDCCLSATGRTDAWDGANCNP